MGTIGALAPIAVGLATQAQLDPLLVAGALLSGAMFGDNLSIISDTTIASTRTQGANMQDKFRQNFWIALPAALITILIFSFVAETQQAPVVKDFSWTAVIPYAAILILALAGLNVFIVLLLGIVLAALQGVVFADYAIANLGKDIFKGFSSMQEIFLLSMLVGALGEFLKRDGGLVWIAKHIEAMAASLAFAGNKAQQLAIAGLVFLSNLCIANNTVAIVVSGDVSKKIADDHQISPARSASLLDIFSCISQGLVPYGAQALLLGASFGVSPWDVVTHSYYCMVLTVAALVAIAVKRS
jgi:Na+/H+ antiporter NhaC